MCMSSSPFWKSFGNTNCTDVGPAVWGSNRFTALRRWRRFLNSVYSSLRQLSCLLCMGGVVDIYTRIFKLWERKNREIYSWNVQYHGGWGGMSENNYLKNCSLCSLISLRPAHAKLRIHESIWQSMACGTSWASCWEDLLIHCIICGKHDRICPFQTVQDIVQFLRDGGKTDDADDAAGWASRHLLTGLVTDFTAFTNSINRNSCKYDNRNYLLYYLLYHSFE